MPVNNQEKQPIPAKDRLHWTRNESFWTKHIFVILYSTFFFLYFFFAKIAAALNLCSLIK